MTVPTRRRLSLPRTWSLVAFGAAIGLTAGFAPGIGSTTTAHAWHTLSLARTSGSTLFQQEAEFDREQLLKDYIHYVLIARPDLARGSARALIDTDITPAELYRLIDEIDASDRLSDALDRSARIPELQEVAGELQSMIRQGRIDVARDPAEIDRHINNLTGSARAQMMAREGLRAAGEYAVPQLIDVLRSSASVAKKSAVRGVLVEIGRQAVTPLTVLLPHADPVLQEQIAVMLGQIGWKHAQPALLELIRDNGTEPRVRQTAEQAYRMLGGSMSDDLVEQWVALAEQYWAEFESLVAWPDEPMNNIWMYRPESIGLTMVQVPTEIFHEVMTMRVSENALKVSSESDDALAL
ncbi:MAG: HEAT repeat domain-containing protein, partial [Planctomycetota bacterium]